MAPMGFARRVAFVRARPGYPTDAMRGRGLRAAAITFLASLALGGCGQLKVDELTRGVKTLRSIAAEGALMADDVARDRTKVTFVRVHGAELSESAGHEAEKLNDSQRPADLDPEVKEAIQIAEAESDAIDKLRVAPGDRAQARDQRAELRHQAVRANQLVGRLDAR
jgi:hypothetical protein